MSKSSEELEVKSSSGNSSPINVEDVSRHYLASPQGRGTKGDDYFASDTIVDHCSENDDGQAEGAIPVSDEEDAGTTDQQLQHQNLYDPYGQQLETQPVSLFNEIDDIYIAGEITTYVNKNHINFGELETVMDLWQICDAISAEHGGLPDSLLKEALLIVLESYHNKAKYNSWQRQDAEKLIRIWKTEMLKGKSTFRPSKFVSAPAFDTLHTDNKSLDKDTNGKQEELDNKTAEQATEIHQPSLEDIEMAKKQKKKEKRRKRKIHSLGIGQILTNVRRKMITEDEELEVKEDEFGNFSVGGMPLSFENWGQLNKIKEDDIVHVGIQPSEMRLKKNSMSLPHSNGVVASQKHKQSDFLLFMAEKYPTVHEVEMPSNDTQQIPASILSSVNASTSATEEIKDPTKVKSPVPPQSKEKDEGELSSSESDKPTSSDESSGEESKQNVFALKKNATLLTKNIQDNRLHRMVHERRRVKQNEQPQGKQGISSRQNLQQLLQKCFDLRGQIVRKLNIQQKAMFMDLLKQSMAGTLQQGVQNLQQQQAMALLMNTINSSGIDSSSL
ncbi:hypothetical protein Mgra_00000815 [Meloidogyne graminicola]|uniref:Uncharacterized protein n=1 Tax=Meloidogyne graminicola TaxID=189291 RepID=A0A8T0A1E1_9BILA|nr:hypothetical protein Mgra_00000815 [Meloidogyne graminicola]